MDVNTKYNIASSLTIISIISCTLAFSSIIGVIIISKEQNFRNISTDVQVDILAILVTVLIGWQILNYMQFKDSMRKIAQDEVNQVTEDYKSILDGLIM